MRRKNISFIISMILAVSILAPAPAAPKEIEPSDLPNDVVETLNAYLTVLTLSKSAEDAGAALIAKSLIGGHLISTDGKSASRDIIEFSLKKDRENVRFYALPADISRVTVSENDYDGFQKTLFEGTRYKIWIRKKPGISGMPAPIPVIKPANGRPKVVSTIGSL